MEGQVARRRISTIAGHFVAGEEISAAAAHVVPLNCSASLNSVIRRCDNKMYFARQGSSSQGSFMRQASIGQQVRPTQPGTCQGSSNASGAPLFSRPSRIQQTPNFGLTQPTTQRCNLAAAEPAPRFARPDRRMSRPKQSNLKRKVHPPNSTGAKWSPRMDVVESERNYVLTVEVPGVNSKDIRVEVSDQKLTVMGMRQAWNVSGFANDSIMSYHKREITQGPYQITWPLPTNVNKDSVSAEFVEGFLQIIVPKL